MPAEADAPPDLVTPATASAGGLGLPGARFQHVDARHVGIDEVELADSSCASSAAIGEPGEAVVRRRARHRDRALGQRIEAFALEIVGRNRPPACGRR